MTAHEPAGPHDAHAALCPSSLPLLDRRRLLALLGLGGMTAAGLPIAPVLAAGGTDALLLNCIDYRLTAATTEYMTAHQMAGKYDQCVLAGASLGAKNDKFPAWGRTFWDHVQIAIDLHHIHKVVVIDHRDCGAYKVILGKDLAGNPVEEYKVHATEMRSLRADISRRHPKLEVELLLMALDGSVEKVT